MLTLADWSTRHRRLVVVLWVVVLVAAIGISRAVGSHYANNFTLPGTGAQRASDLLARGFRHSRATSTRSSSTPRAGRFPRRLSGRACSTSLPR
ncbi:MAG: hypothetical protein ACXVRK_01020 [Gaiellaceae bacterium]